MLECCMIPQKNQSLSLLCTTTIQINQKKKMKAIQMRSMVFSAPFDFFPFLKGINDKLIALIFSSTSSNLNDKLERLFCE